jgi:hypothetical protein
VDCLPMAKPNALNSLGDPLKAEHGVHCIRSRPKVVFTLGGDPRSPLRAWRAYSRLVRPENERKPGLFCELEFIRSMDALASEKSA